MMESLYQPASDVIGRFWFGVSNIIGALVVFLLGWLVARFVGLVVTKFFKITRIDKFSDEAGIRNILEKGNISKDVSELLGIAVYWILMLVVLFTAIGFAGVVVPSTVVDSLLGFIPRFILGLVIFIFSLFLGSFFSGIVRTAAGNVGIEHAPILGKATHVAIVIFGSIISLQQIGVAGDFLGHVFMIILASICFGFALSFALGTKDLMKKYAEEFLIKKDKKKKEDKDS